MNLNDYKYHIVTTKLKNEKWNKYTTDVDPKQFQMRTMCLYDQTAIDYINNNGSLKGYAGKKRATELIIDFDNHGQEKTSFLKKRDELINFLIWNFNYSFSIWGTKIKEGSSLYNIIEDEPSGLHISIPFEYEIDPCEDMHQKLKFLALNLFESKFVDTAIYSDHRMIRVEKSTRECGFGKYFLYAMDADAGLTPSLLTGYSPTVKEIIEESEYINPKWIRNGIVRRCLFEEIPIGSRHGWISSSCGILKKMGFNRQQTYPLIVAMLANCRKLKNERCFLTDDTADGILDEHY